MPQPLDALTAVLGEVADLHQAASLLEWDEQVYMPPGGAATHGHMVATLRKAAHQRFTSDEVGALLTGLAAEQADLDDVTGRLVSVASRDYRKARRVPAEFIAEQAQAVSAGQHAWVDARARGDFDLFRPHLARAVALKRQYVTFFPPAAHPYDVLLDDFEQGMTTADVQALFGVLRPRQVELIRALGQRPQVDSSFLQLAYDEQELWDFSREVVGAIGFDWHRGRQDRSVHPFATGIGPDDVRITTRFVPHEPLSLVFGAVHETGHALYEQGINPAFTRHSLGGAVSLGVHESQSRLWENIVGRSRGFWQHFLPALQRRFPAQLASVTLDQFYKGINRVQPSMIRVEADEATYNLHVMLRVELEIELIEGRLSVDDLPDAWNDRMRAYLGLTPPDVQNGVLQDIHWSIGAIGYFATYTLGNVVSAQLWEAFGRVNPARDDEIARGEFRPLLAWLREHIHAPGRMYLPQELVERATGSRIDPAPYLRYLEEKYRVIYGLSPNA